MNALTVVIGVLTFIGWSVIAVMSFEHFVTGIDNRFRFRTIFYISILIMMDVIVGMYIILNPDINCVYFHQLRWGLFVITELVFYHLTIYGTNYNRTVQLVVTILFLTVMANSIFNSSALTELIITGILIFNSYMHDNRIIKKHLTITFILYMVLSISYTGENMLNLLLGFVFTVYFWWTVAMLYEEEGVGDILISRDMNRRKELK